MRPTVEGKHILFVRIEDTDRNSRFDALQVTFKYSSGLTAIQDTKSIQIQKEENVQAQRVNEDYFDIVKQFVEKKSNDENTIINSFGRTFKNVDLELLYKAVKRMTQLQNNSPNRALQESSNSDETTKTKSTKYQD